VLIFQTENVAEEALARIVQVACGRAPHRSIVSAKSVNCVE
jgi:hypothetical protein